MSVISYFYEAFIFGFILSAIVGPIFMLCVKKTLEGGFAQGMAVGLGASIADGVYGFIVGAGMTAVSDFLLANTFYIKLIGGLFLIYLAYKEIKQDEMPKAIPNSGKNFLSLTLQSFLLTMANPLTILVFLAMFTNIGDGNVTSSSAAAMITGVVLGSIALWVILCFATLKLKHNLSAKLIYRIRVASAAVLAGFGLWSIYDII